MVRTQIYLTQKQYTRLAQRAALSKVSVSQLIRDMIDKQLGEGKKRKNAGNFLLEMAREAEKRGFSGSADLASNVDEYLYGEKAK